MLNDKIYKYLTSDSNVYTNKLDNIVDKYNNLYHKTIKMKLVDVKSSSYIDFEIENNVKDKITNLKLAGAWEHQNVKTFFFFFYTPYCAEE